MTDAESWPYVLLLHGYTGAGRGHWQSWLAHELADAGAAIDVPVFSDPDCPSLDAWLGELTHHLEAAPRSGKRVVVAHALGAALWLHHAARVPADPALRVDRVLLVAPPGAAWRSPDVHGFTPAPLDAAGIRRAAGWTQLVTGENDAYLPVGEAVTMAADLKIDLDVIPAGGALDSRTGYGPWPSVLDWVRDRHTRLTAHATLP
ncbi:RBBP9/YdeN family alpha/beta hydrolase [Actinokineospora sp.]|uniref:RBBP9/YdeN family alpha/beta hydrolase n=1 Tax=Actinokineospora sp. TaxID=1872133 RepID=UPI0040382DD7